MLIHLKNIDTAVTCDDRDHVYHNTELWFEDGKIVRIGPFDIQPDREYD